MCGTAAVNRGLPEILMSIKPSKSKTILHKNNDVLLQIWNNDKRNVHMISTIHSSTLIDSVNRRTKQLKILSQLDNNKYMKGVGQADQLLAFFPFIENLRKGQKDCNVFYQLFSV